jgi:hypothetical protein
MILITSAAYIDAEFRSELGKIPPAFLPIGNRRLYRYQQECLQSDDHIVLTVPENYQIPSHDLKQIESMSIEVLAIPEGLSLGESIVCALNLCGHSSGPLQLLHGDTLVYDIPKDQSDIISVSEVEDNYEWATFDGESLKPFHPYSQDSAQNKSVVSGYFKFSDTRLVIQSITRARGKFIEGVNRYAKERPLKAFISDRWFDFGHLHTYFRSKTHISTARAFNTLKIDDGVVTKLSDMPNKMAAESQWFSNIPNELKRFTPNFLGTINDASGVPGYRIEYQCISSLNELFVFGDLPVFVWDKIIRACLNFIQECQLHPNPATEVESFKSFVATKTEKRLAQFAEESGISLGSSWTLNGLRVPSLNDIHAQTIELVPSASGSFVCHGDFCFSNILYDFRAQSIKVIDPRGIDNQGALSIYGYPLYDIAKLAHSIIGKYDFIIAGYFELEQSDYDITFDLFETEAHNTLKTHFKNVCAQSFGLDIETLYALQIQLFLSMLPLHSDQPKRQKALLANALNLYMQMTASNEDSKDEAKESNS